MSKPQHGFPLLNSCFTKYQDYILTNTQVYNCVQLEILKECGMGSNPPRTTFRTSQNFMYGLWFLTHLHFKHF